MKGFFKIVFSWVWPYLKAVGQVLLSKTTPELLRIAAEYIVEAETNPELNTGLRKKRWVARKLKEANLLVGNQYADMIISFVVDFVVVKLTAEENSGVNDHKSITN